MERDRASLGVDTLLRIVLGLIAVYLILEILGELLSLVPDFLGTIISLVIAVVIILWLLDRI